MPTNPAAWSTPSYSRTQVDAAGAAVIRERTALDEQRRARVVVNDWRAAHSLPLERVRIELQERVAGLGGDALVAQRLKRLSSIDMKLRRFPTMRLARMQDVGGCRAVLPSATDVQRVAEDYASRPPRHPISHVDDYISGPKSSGYRGVHLVGRFRPASEQEAPYEGMRIEIQLRSRIQHVWATTVETVALFSGQALKSSIGDANWLRLLALMGSEFAFDERLPVVPDTPRDRKALREELAPLARALDASARLQRYRETLRVQEGLVRNGRAEYFHIVVESTPNDSARVRWNEYAEEERDEAIRAFEEVEAAIGHFPGADTVLVRVASVEALRDAYPSYFADTRDFVERLTQATG